MKLLIAKVNETLFDGEAYSLTAPGTAGELTVLKDHMPLVTTLKTGVISVRETKDGSPKEFSVETGVLEVTTKGATVLL